MRSVRRETRGQDQIHDTPASERVTHSLQRDAQDESDNFKEPTERKQT